MPEWYAEGPLAVLRFHLAEASESQRPGVVCVWGGGGLISGPEGAVRRSFDTPIPWSMWRELPWSEHPCGASTCQEEL